MRNSGSDSCIRCGFNRHNNWHWNLTGEDCPRDIAYCEIRELEIPHPHFSNCVNWHTQKLEPEGPVFSATRMADRIPWFGNSIPTELDEGRCVVCSKIFNNSPNDLTDGVGVVGDDGTQFQFCSCEHYLAWWRKQRVGIRLPFYDYMPHSRTQDQVADEWRAIGVNLRRHWWEFWKV